MNISDILKRIIKPILIPFAMLYGLIIWLRNKLYDSGFLSSVQFSVPVISVGNLSTGGTGKTPHVEYIIEHFQYEYKLATLSRGYRRRTKGFILADNKSTAYDIGDEPLQFYKKYPEIYVSVCEDRITGIPRLKGEKPEVEVVILDDAYQHRSVKPGHNILIMDYNRPFYKDYILPFGSLRESRKAYKRADTIIVSKCPDNISQKEISDIQSQIKPFSHQKLYFSTIQFQPALEAISRSPEELSSYNSALIVCGIAHPESFIDYVKKSISETIILKYNDHHYFNLTDIQHIINKHNDIMSKSKCLVTTEKDFTRLSLYSKELEAANIKILILPIRIKFIEDGANFTASLRTYIENERNENWEL